MSSEMINEYAYILFCNFERRRILSIFTDDEAIKIHLDTLWYDLNKYHYEDVELYYSLSKNYFNFRNTSTVNRKSFIKRFRDKIISLKIF